MSYNFISKDAEIRVSPRCVHDTAVGYESDFSENGNVDGWEYYEGIHTYGCWNSFLFGTLYGTSAVIGRYNVFSPVPAETHYTVKIAMKIDLADRVANVAVPTHGRVMWRTLSDPLWGSDKNKDFTIYPDGQWHVYILNMGEEQWWQGDVNDLRIYPILSDGRDGDEFYIRNIQITSVEVWQCRNVSCDYYSNYSHPCAGVGIRGRCESSSLTSFIDNIMLGPDGEELLFTIEKDVNDEFIVNINGYGDEIVRLDEVVGASGLEIAKILAKNIAGVSIGGYNEVEVEYNSEDKKFTIHSGTYNDDSSVRVIYNNTAVFLGFFDGEGADLSSKYLGQTPVSGFVPLSTFRLGTAQLLGFFDNDEDTSFEFNPFMYNVEGGRSDWLSSGFGITGNAIAGDQTDTSGAVVREYNTINNYGKTLIDFGHPFNASGRIKKIYAGCTLDNPINVPMDNSEYKRRDAETEGASVKIFRPKRDGRLETIHSIVIPDRDRNSSKLYSMQQEATIIDCDLWVNKGDLLGVYGAHLYSGKSITGSEVGALYYQINGEVYSEGQDVPYTKDLCTGGRILESSHSGDYVKGNAFDGNYDTFWKSSTNQYGWLTYDFGEGNEKVIELLRLKAPSTGVYDFNVRASNDGVSWVTVLSEYYGSHVRETYGIPNSAAFRYYKLTVTSCHILTIYPAINDIELKAVGYTVETNDIFDPGILYGQGSSGLLIYARSDVSQHKLSVDIDLGHRINIKDITIKGEPESAFLDYNITRCLDINWSVDLFGETHKTGHIVYSPVYRRKYCTHPNLCYGIDKLSDGILCVPDGLAADSFSVDLDYDGLQGYYGEQPLAMSAGVIPVNPKYFFVNGDTEWLGAYQWGGYPEPFIIEFDYDPIAFTLDFPSSKLKTIYKFKTYFKERWNCRSFALSTYLGPIRDDGDADDPHFRLIPEYTAVTLDNISITQEESVGINDLYLFTNPSIGHAITEQIGDTIVEFDDTFAYWDPMAGITFSKQGQITNMDQHFQALQMDWNVLEHKFEPIDCEGFRFYCNFHKSTKITEMELYCIMGESSSSMAGSITLVYSKYQDLWWPISVSQIEDDSVEAFVGDTPRYFNIEIQPILSIKLRDMIFSADIKDVYVGEKGCEYDVFLDSSKSGEINDSQKIDIKNIYGESYNLHVDISADENRDNELIFYSKLDGVTSVENPEVGPDAYYYKQDNYPLVNQQGNCAINCECYGLNNLIDGKKAYSSQDDMRSWDYVGVLAENTNIDSPNIASIGVSIASIPVLLRNRYWKIGFLCCDQVMDVREIKVNFEGVEQDCIFYHDKNLEYETGPISDTAPHLNNGSVMGSYYRVMDDHYIGFDLGGGDKIDKITLFHDQISDYCGSKCGIDKYTSLCLQGRGADLSSGVADYSYYEHNIEIVGDVRVNKPHSSGDLFVGGVVSASSYYTSHHPSYAVDDDLDTYWRAPAPCWWQYDLGEDGAEAANLLIMDVYNADPYDPPSMFVPNNFDILGSNNESDWDALATGLTAVPGTKRKTFYFSNSAAYRYYRLDIHSATNVNNVILPELQLRRVDPDVLNWLTSEFPVEGDNGCIRFGGTVNDYIRVPYSECLFVDGSGYSYPPDRMCFSMDFWMKFDSYPPHEIDLMSGVFSIKVTHEGTDQVRFKLHTDPGTVFTFPLRSWHHVYIFGYAVTGSTQWQVYIDGTVVDSSWLPFLGLNGQDLIIGKQFDGWLAEVRYTIGEPSGIFGEYYTLKQYERYYTMSVYSSHDNLTYYKYCDVDLMFDNSYSYYFPGNKFSEYYNSYFAIDLGKRYNLGLLRSYGASDALDCSLTENVIYSNNDVTDINDVVFDSDYTDARWVCVTPLSGDGQTRVIRKLGIYPDISTSRAPGGGYNTSWDSLGRAVTVYESGSNIALEATISGSSFFWAMSPEKLVDGLVTGATLDDVWGSDDESTQWVTIDLGSVYDIYRVKMYHGVMGFDPTTGGTTEDHDYMITDYIVQVSEAGATYDTIFEIADNDEFERVHDLSEPASARYIRIYITGFRSRKVSRKIAGGEYAFFEGAVLREIEIYEYYGFTSINSEIYPIMCINLRDQFYLYGHSLVGVDIEDDTINWSNSDSNFCYSDSVLDDPRKISFGSWGGGPVYEQWVAIKNDTATYHNDGPDYLKHAIIKASIKPNPCDYHWWWTSRLSALSNTYNYDTQLCSRTLQIDYPTSSGSDTISLVEGDTFGVDSVLSWRDACSFRLHIDNIDNFDADYSYFYFGGVDTNNNLVRYKWLLKPFVDAGALDVGWNSLYFRFKSADEVIYTESPNFEDTDMRTPKNLTLKTMGLVFRGKGDAFTMFLDGFNITRNHFGDSMLFGQNGLYLTGNDYLTCPIADIDFSGGAIEWWFRPDYAFSGYDYYGEFKHRSLFHFSNASNDVFGAVVHLEGFLVYYGNINTTLASFVTTELDLSLLDRVFHVGIVFSNTGTNIDADGSTIRLYIDNFMVAKVADPWDIGDSKHFKFLFGGQSLLELKQTGFDLRSSSVDGVLSNLKIYNYCKTDFSDSITGVELPRYEKLVKPSQLIEISKDNLTFYKAGDHQYLPFIFEGVPAGDTKSVYMRSCVPDGLTGRELRTAGIVASWNISV